MENKFYSAPWSFKQNVKIGTNVIGFKADNGISEKVRVSYDVTKECRHKQKIIATILFLYEILKLCQVSFYLEKPIKTYRLGDRIHPLPTPRFISLKKVQDI